MEAKQRYPQQEGQGNTLMDDQSPTWLQLCDERQRKEIEFDRLYDNAMFRHGTDGHNARLIISKLAEMLDRVEKSGVDIQALYEVKP